MKPTVIYTRPATWSKLSSDKLDLVHVPIHGSRPLRKSGRPAAPDAPMLLANPTGVEELIKKMRELRPQVLLRGINTGLSRTAHEKIREASPSTLIFVADGNDPNRVSTYAERYKYMIDGFLLNTRDKENYDRYRDIGYKYVDTMYDGFDPGDFPRPGPKAHYDCFFGGSNRRHAIDREEKIPGSDIIRKHRVWEYDFPGGKFRFNFISMVRNKFRLLLHGPNREWPWRVEPILHYPKYSRIFRRARIALGCNHYDLERYYTRRLIQAGASGRLFLTKYIPGMERDFENKKHLVWFNNIDEGIDLVRYYLKHDSEREKIAANGRAHFMRVHTWEARLRQFERYILSIL